MVTDDLVELDQVGAELLEPRREPLVQHCAARLRQRLVGGVANKEMPEAVRLVGGDRGRVGADKLLADEGDEPRVDLPLIRGEREHCAAMEDLALDRAALEHGALVGRESVEPGREQRVDRRRHGDLAVRLPRELNHLLDEERIAAGGVSDPSNERFVAFREQAADKLIGLLAPERLQQHRRCVQLASAPTRPRVEQLRPPHAEQQDRRVPGEVCDVLDQVEERRLPPVDVVEDDHERQLRGGGLERLPHRPGGLRGRGRRIELAEEHRDRPLYPLVAARLAELLQDLDHRPVRDALAVGQAASAQHARVFDGRKELRDESRLARRRRGR